MSAPAGGAADAGAGSEGRRRSRARGCLGALLRFGGWSLALFALLLAAAFLLLRSDWAAERGLRLLQERLSETFERPVHVGRVELRGWPPSLTAYDLVIPGREPSDPPFARVPEIEVQLDLSGTLHEPHVHVRQVFVRAPEVRLELDADGSSNLPEIRTGEGGGRVEVTFGSLIVRDGVFVLDEQRLPFALEATAVRARAESTGGADDRRFAGSLSAGEVTFTLPDARPYGGALAARMAVEQGRVEITALRLAAPEVTMTVEGAITWDDAGRAIDLAVAAHGRAEVLNRLGYAEEPIEGPLQLAGRFEYAVAPGAEGEWTFTSDLASERLATYGMVFTDAAAALTAGAAGVTVDIDHARYAGGTLAGTVAVPSRPDGAEEGPARVETDLRFEDLALAPLLADREIELEGLTASLSGHAVYRFTTDAPAAGDGEVQVAVEAVERRPGALPIAGEAALTIRDGVVATDGAVITAEGQRVTASGSYDLAAGRGRFAYRLRSTDLVPLYRALPLPAEPPGEPAPWRLTAGSGTVEGELTLAPAPAGVGLTAALDLDAVRTPALAFDRVSGTLRLTAEAVHELDLVAEAGGGELRVTGTVPLGEEPGAPPFDLALDLDEWPLAGLAPLLPPAVPALEGRVSGRIDLAGSVDALEGRAELTAAPLRVAASEAGDGGAGTDGIAAERVEAVAVFDPRELRLERLEAVLAAGTVSASGSLEHAGGAVQATLAAPALDLAAPPFADLVPGALSGTLALEATAGGTLDRPDVRLALGGTGLGLAGRPLGEDGAADASVHWADGRLEAAGSLLGLVRFEGGGRLDPGAGSEAIDVELSLAGDDLRALAQLAAEQPLPEFSGSFAGTLEIAGAWPEEAGAVEGLTARLALDRLALAYEGLAVANLEPVTARVEDGVLRLESLYLGHAGRDGAAPAPSAAAAGSADELFVAGTADLGADGVPLDLDFQGSLGATWLEPMLPGAELQGTVLVLGRVRGTAAAPRINGQGEVEGGNAILPGFPHALEAITARVFFDPGGSLIVDRLSADVAGGDVLAQGRLDLPGEGDAEATYRLQARARGFSLRWPEGFVLRGGADLSLISEDGVRQITGVVDLDRIFYLQDVTVSLTRLLTEALQRQRLEVGQADTELASTLLNVAVRGPLRVRNNIADLEGRAELVVRGTLAAPVLFGQVAIEPGGKITYAETEYEVERGLLTFANPIRIDPVIDLVARTEVDGYDVSLQLAGTLDRLDARFTSDPPLADLQVLQLLATGTAPTGGSGFPGQAPEQTGGAAALLYGQAASLVTERVNVLFGFDRFRVSPGVGGAVGFAVGKRLSRDFYVTVSNDPVNDIDYVVQAEWRISDFVTVVLTQRGEEAFAVDLRWEKRF